MFHGAYMIIKVKHNIKPNYMSTTFTGTRIRRIETPIIDVAEAYMSLIETLELQSAGTSKSTTVSGSFPPIVSTIIENGGSNGNIQVGNIQLKAIPFNSLKAIGDPFNKQNIKTENLLLSEAVDPLVNMLNDWTDWMISEGFSGVKLSGDKKVYAYITSIFRDYDKQVQVEKTEGKEATATPGTSPHGWGIAVDLQFFTKDGSVIRNTKNTASSFKIATNPAIKWLYDNSYKYGWVLPYGLRDGRGLEEHWHWEYHGTAAKCLVEKNKNVYGYVINTSGTLKTFVKNPKDVNGKEAVYINCDYKTINRGDGTDDSKSTAYPDVKPTESDLQMINSLSGTWVNRAKKIISSLESYSEITKWDANAYRGGYGTDLIIKSPGQQPEKVTKNTTFTKQEAELTLEYDVNNRFKNGVIGVLGQANWDKLNDNQKAAIISYTYNTGPGALKTRGIVTSITNNDFIKASIQISDGPITSNGKVVKGLIRRRKIESIVFGKSL
jgi:GH24 family phage-related lysozyme (muramidase)